MGCERISGESSMFWGWEGFLKEVTLKLRYKRQMEVS